MTLRSVRTFYLRGARGAVAHGVVFPDGACVVRWPAPSARTVAFEDVHGATSLYCAGDAATLVFDDENGDRPVDAGAGG